jgi:glycosyltransferase involved in cell wall biosynthesis
MKISYAILTHNEGEYIDSLLEFLIKNKREDDEIIVVDDFSDDPHTINIFEKYKNNFQLYYREFDGDHTQKNYLNSKCSGDFIFQLDADELVSKEFIEILPSLIELNQDIDLFILPRINTVDDLTEDWISKWGWKINDKGWVNFPDWQMRLYKNCDYIKWDGLLHSKIIGSKKYCFLPEEELYSIIHSKKLERQIQQNNLYDNIEKNGRVKYKI